MNRIKNKILIFLTLCGIQNASLYAPGEAAEAHKGTVSTLAGKHEDPAKAQAANEEAARKAAEAAAKKAAEEDLAKKAAEEAAAKKAAEAAGHKSALEANSAPVPILPQNKGSVDIVDTMINNFLDGGVISFPNGPLSPVTSKGELGNNDFFKNLKFDESANEFYFKTTGSPKLYCFVSKETIQSLNKDEETIKPSDLLYKNGENVINLFSHIDCPAKRFSRYSMPDGSTILQLYDKYAATTQVYSITGKKGNYMQRLLKKMPTDILAPLAPSKIAPANSHATTLKSSSNSEQSNGSANTGDNSGFEGNKPAENLPAANSSGTPTHLPAVDSIPTLPTPADKAPENGGTPPPTPADTTEKPSATIKPGDKTIISSKIKYAFNSQMKPADIFAKIKSDLEPLELNLKEDDLKNISASIEKALVDGSASSLKAASDVFVEFSVNHYSHLSNGALSNRGIMDLKNFKNFKEGLEKDQKSGGISSILSNMYKRFTDFIASLKVEKKASQDSSSPSSGAPTLLASLPKPESDSAALPSSVISSDSTQGRELTPAHQEALDQVTSLINGFVGFKNRDLEYGVSKANDGTDYYVFTTKSAPILQMYFKMPLGKTSQTVGLQDVLYSNNTQGLGSKQGTVNKIDYVRNLTTNTQITFRPDGSYYMIDNPGTQSVNRFLISADGSSQRPLSIEEMAVNRANDNLASKQKDLQLAQKNFDDSAAQSNSTKKSAKDALETAKALLSRAKIDLQKAQDKFAKTQPQPQSAGALVSAASSGAPAANSSDGKK